MTLLLFLPECSILVLLLLFGLCVPAVLARLLPLERLLAEEPPWRNGQLENKYINKYCANMLTFCKSYQCCECQPRAEDVDCLRELLDDVSPHDAHEAEQDHNHPGELLGAGLTLKVLKIGSRKDEMRHLYV